MTIIPFPKKRASAPLEPGKKAVISIVIPAYNAEKMIGETIASVLRQTFEDWELIVVDDGSADGTADVVRGFNDARIRLIQPGRIGFLGAVRNKGLSEARGEFLAFMDADDLYEPDALETLHDYLQRTPSCGAVYGYFRVIDETGDLAEKQPPLLLPEGQLEGYRHNWRAILSTDSPNFMQALLMRRSTFERVGWQSDTYNFVPDYLYYIRLFLDDFEGVHYLNKPVFQYRKYGASNTNNRARFQEALRQIPQFCDWIFGPEGVPASVHHLESEINARHYAHMSRSRLNNRDFGQLSETIVTALGNPKVRFKHWLLYVFPFWVRYFSPKPLENLMRAAWAKYKTTGTYLKRDAATAQAPSSSPLAGAAMS